MVGELTGITCWSMEGSAQLGPDSLKSCPRAVPSHNSTSDTKCLSHIRPYADSFALSAPRTPPQPA